MAKLFFFTKKNFLFPYFLKLSKYFLHFFLVIMFNIVLNFRKTDEICFASFANALLCLSVTLMQASALWQVPLTLFFLSIASELASFLEIRMFQGCVHALLFVSNICSRNPIFYGGLPIKYFCRSHLLNQMSYCHLRTGNFISNLKSTLSFSH